MAKAKAKNSIKTDPIFAVIQRNSEARIDFVLSSNHENLKGDYSKQQKALLNRLNKSDEQMLRTIPITKIGLLCLFDYIVSVNRDRIVPKQLRKKKGPYTDFHEWPEWERSLKKGGHITWPYLIMENALKTLKALD